jgi:rhamnulokinase
MGMWMIQCIKKEYDDKYSFVDFVALAKSATDFDSVVDVNDLSFFAPESMIQAVKDYCKKTNQRVPETVGEIVKCVYVSLAKCYAIAVDQIEKITGKQFKEINIVGGGCQNVLMNELTAKFTGRTVVAGPVEATATGNLLAQMLALKEIDSLETGKNVIKESFDIKEINA